MIVLDTNLVSELMRPTPDERVLDWFNRLSDPVPVTTVITVQEIAYGIERLGDTDRARRLLERFEQLLDSGLLGAPLPFTGYSARITGALLAHRAQLGRPMQSADGQIAGIALEHSAALATRNTRDFVGLRLTLVNPWEPPG